MQKTNHPMLMLLIAVFVIFLAGQNAIAGSFMDKFIDPKDGKFDASDWFLKHKGFLPVPLIVTEPAVGFGAGLNVMFFHQSMDEKIAKRQIDTDETVGGKKIKLLPPSISGAYGFKTENDTWSAGGYHFGSWKGDRIRYVGALAKASVNIKYYGRSDDSILKNGLDYNLDGWFFYQDLMFRMGSTDIFIGGKFTYFDATSTFDFGQNPTGIETWELDFKNAGLGLSFGYDTRDNLFAPSYGMHTDITATFFTGKGLLDKTREYQITDLKNRWYREMVTDLVLGWKVEANLSSGNVPFYALPHISLRGIPINRYQGTHALQTELEATYNLTYRWALVPFAGVGATADALDEFGSGDPKFAGGLGFRYLIARQMRLTAGADIAYSEEGWALYFKVGSGL
ncbi:glyceraldehyde-3-phosphate dehydrogenase [Thermodesulfobacteriota bacterium]